MFVIICAALVACVVLTIGPPIFRYFQDLKGFRKYPSQNPLSGFTNFAYGMEKWRSHRYFQTERLHHQLLKHPVVRLGPNWLSFRSSQAVKDIYGYTSQCSKGPLYDALQGGGQNLVLISDRGLHSSRRKMVASAYAPKQIEKWEPMVAETTSILVSKMDALCTTPLITGTTGVPCKEDLTFDGNWWALLYCFEGATKIGLSKDLGFIAQGSDLIQIQHPDGKVEKVNLIECARGGASAASTLVYDTPNFPTFIKLSKLISPWYAGNWAKGAKWRAAVEYITKERIERQDNGEVLDDLLGPMIEDPKTGAEADINVADRYSEVEQIVNGGGDGPGISLTNTLYYLIKNPETMTRLRAELDEVLAPEDVVAPWSKLKNLSYLRACVDESMRLSPPIATNLTRRTPPNRPSKIADEVVPPNTVVSISAYTAHRDPEIFPDPEAFKPERWLMKGDDRLRNMLAVYIAFSAGSRACIGRNVTILMQFVYLATLITRYEFALPNPDWEMKWRDYFNLWPEELPLKIWRRERQASA
ncbi:cytochrome P450 CYP5280A1P [Truncatella angustata]|uniref:Cytochrome P450 CYP5280A1P n=1 Tax=Truncatella angustata TaxID=152316 RepID=A0A9P8REZ1_9PEZI|nr:cytochrome P450 CYP5280A1P [Truncatella angustata]KAH6643362.1 cytochrome P450 CYP5280A1P [Truncatella angustata]